MYTYSVAKNEFINFVRYSEISSVPFNAKNDVMTQPVNLEESYIQIVYPQRKEFKETIKEESFREVNYENIYYPFENNKVEFSKFQPTTHVLSFESELYVECDKDEEFTFEITTCGIVQIFVNEETQFFFAPMTRNVGSKKEFKLSFKKGMNKVNIFTKELAERDVYFFYAIKNIGFNTLNCMVKTEESESEINRKMDLLQSIYFEKDQFDSVDDIKFGYESKYLNNDEKIYLRDYQKVTEIMLSKNEETYNVGDINSLPNGLYRVTFEIDSIDGIIKREVLFGSALPHVYFDTFEERLEYVTKGLIANSPTNVTKSLLLIENGIMDEEFHKGLYDDLAFIDSRADCADFKLVPLLWMYIKYESILSDADKVRIKETLLNFRYWLDEPGNDAMWWFSENHAFLFHISEYLAGKILADEIFTVSGKPGKHHEEMGKQRLIHWFEVFNEFEFAEWNSTTYFPVDFIGFLTLFECAHDEELKELSKNGLDKTFDIIDANTHHNFMPSTYGRVYEGELKGLENGELALITWLMWGQGQYNYSNRASSLIAISSYRHTRKLVKANSENFIYKQGFNEVLIHVHYHEDYQMATAVNYKYKLKGHQQHIMNISFSKEEIPMWINNPGEFVYSGESRPSFWAGNGTLPQVFPHDNTMIYSWENMNSFVPFSHLYFPTFKFNKYEIIDNVILVEHSGALFGLKCSSKFNLITEGAVANREIRFEDIKGGAFIKLESTSNISYEEFKEQFINASVRVDNETTEVIFNGKSHLVTNNQYFIDGKLKRYPCRKF